MALDIESPYRIGRESAKRLMSHLLGKYSVTRFPQ